MSDCKHEEWSEWIMNPNCKGKKIISKYRDCLMCWQRERIWKDRAETEEDFIARDPKEFSYLNFERLAGPEEQLQHVLKCHKIHRSRLENQIKGLEAENRQLYERITELETTDWHKKYLYAKDRYDKMIEAHRGVMHEFDDSYYG